MKTIWVFLFVLYSGICYSQYIYDSNIYSGILSDLYINHQPNPKSEAMGRGLAANSDGDYGAYYNPALTSLNKGYNYNFSYTEAKAEKPSLPYYEFSYSNEKFGTMGISVYYFSKAGSYRYNKNFHDAVYTLNYSQEVIKDFYAGINLGVFSFSDFLPDYYTISPLPDDGITLDIGVLKKFEINSSESKQVVHLASALYNLTNSKVIPDLGGFLYKSPLPVIFRFAASYDVIVKEIKAGHEWNPVRSFTHIEFEKIVNSEYAPVFKVGEEFTLENVVCIRLGLVFSKIEEFDYSYKKTYQPKFTKGIGLNIPLQKIFHSKNPLTLKIDYANSTLSHNDKFSYDYNGSYYSLAFGLNYIP